MKKVYAGDTGTDIVLDTGYDLTGSDSDATVSINVTLPDGTKTVWDSTVCAVRGVMSGVRHKTASGDLEQSGLYELRSHVSFADGSWSGHGEPVTLEVLGL